jgi:RNA polymerase sigma-70 factor (ECF subfamily)
MALDRQQFEQQTMEHLDTLYRVARRLARDPGKAEDLVQETFLRAFRFRDTYEPGEFGIRPWLIRIMRNLHLTSAGREAKQPHAVDQEQLDSAASASSSSLSDLKNFDFMDERLGAAIHSLAEEYQTALLLWAVEELSYKEIAAALDVPIGTVMSRLHRARSKLSEQLGDLAKEMRLPRE